MRQAHDHEPSQLCGPDCRYRGLYEGSQRSMADLATQQASALGRVGRLRANIVVGLKRIMPNEFTEAERALGRRLSEVEDELLAAYLESFLLLAAGRANSDSGAVVRLRTVLAKVGLDVGSAKTLAEIVTMLEQLSGSPGGDLNSLFGASSLPELPPAMASTPVHEPSDVTSAKPQEQAGTPEHQAYRDQPAHDTQESSAHRSPAVQIDYADLFGDDPSDSRYLDDLFGDEPSSTDLSELFDEPTQLSPTESASPDVPIPEPAHGAQGQDVPLVETPSRAMDSNKNPETATSSKQETIVGPWASDPPTTGAGVTARALATGGGMKPSLIPISPKTRTRRNRAPVRASATPGETSLDVPVDQGADSTLDVSMRDRLLAAVCIPRPVFSADLVELVKSAEVVADWEAERMSGKETSVVIIPAKSRHKLRGSLIFSKNYLNDGPVEFRRSLWAQCLSLYRGAKLYELGVVLHRFGEEVVSYELGPQIAILRLSLPKGLVGLIMVLDTAMSEEDEARKSLVNALETLMKERLVQIAVLSYVAESIDMMAAVVAEEAARRGWTPTMPVTLSRSWEFTSNTGTALPLLG
jgi:hypothetical protein